MYEKALWQQGLGYVNDKGEVTVDSAENIATLEKFGEFWKANLLSDQQEWTDGWYADFSGKDKSVAGIVMAAWYGGFLKVWMAPDTKGLWGVTLMPAMKAGQVRAANDGGSTFIIPEQSKNKEAAWAYIEFMLGRVPSQVKMLTAADLFPSLIPSFEDKAFSEPDPFFGGQTTRKLYVDVALKIPKAMVYGPNYDEINRFVSTAIQKYATGAASAKDALKEAADAIRQQTGLK
jgi:ABC-type glycerol-3-phosphate transport system substrate-binding protein